MADFDAMQTTEHRPSRAPGRGGNLFYRAWLPAKPANQALLLFHRGHEHSGRWQETVEALEASKMSLSLHGTRGHGHSPGERGSAENLGAVIRDVEAFVSASFPKHHQIPIENMVVMAHSVGLPVTAAA